MLIPDAKGCEDGAIIDNGWPSDRWLQALLELLKQVLSLQRGSM